MGAMRERERREKKKEKKKKRFFRFCNALTEGRETVVKTEYNNCYSIKRGSSHANADTM
jgi:hypothetical protein